jgi:hypothetical protein
MPDAKNDGAAPSLPSSPGYRRCPQCAEEIPGNVVKCPHCGDFVDGRPQPVTEQPSWLDEQFLKTSMVVLVLVSFLVGCVALPMGLIGVIACKHPEARKKAIVMLIISGIIMALGVLSAVVRQ